MVEREGVYSLPLDSVSEKKDKNWNQILIETLLEMDIIKPYFTGSVTLHFGQGSLSDIDRQEKSLRRLPRSRKNNGKY
jgi:hypothetical protein